VTPGDEVAGRYRLEELHGRGPMSEVWRAHDETLDRTVALKILGPSADLERFRREARSVASLGHENVMRVYDYGEDAAGPFMALEWLPGGTLEERLANGILPAAETERIARGVAAGLSHLHARGFVHRDLKPANVLFDAEERPKLADFGLARSAAGAGALTEAGTVLGTAAYISPEQAGGESATPASDVYSFGVMLFRMLTGVLPFVADDALTLVTMHRDDPAPAVEDLSPTAPPGLAALANAALRKDPAERPPDGDALLAALGAPAAAALAADAEQTQVLPTATPAARSRRGVALLTTALVLLAGLGAVLAWAVTRPPETAPAGVVSTDGNGHRHTVSTGTTGPTGTTAPISSTGAPTTTGGTTTHRQTTTAQTTTRSATTTARTTTTTPTTPATTTTPTTSTTPTTTTVPTTTTGVTVTT
jgi:eukaryotic-like serine/threonine-protein kinase